MAVCESCCSPAARARPPPGGPLRGARARRGRPADDLHALGRQRRWARVGGRGGGGARFHSPRGVAVDASGIVYVADTFNRSIRRTTPAGEVTTLAGLARNQGSSERTGSAARFQFPGGIGVDGSGNVYVADAGAEALREVTSAGVVTTVAGPAGVSGSADGTESAARFYDPSDADVDAFGNLNVADGSNPELSKMAGGRGSRRSEVRCRSWSGTGSVAVGRSWLGGRRLPTPVGQRSGAGHGSQALGRVTPRDAQRSRTSRG